MVTAEEGENVIISCHSHNRNVINWKFCKTLDERSCDNWVINGVVKENLRSKLLLDRSNISSEELTVRKVDADDTGVFVCVSGDGYGNKQYTYLRVMCKWVKRLSLH